MLCVQGVNVQFDICVYDLEMVVDGQLCIVIVLCCWVVGNEIMLLVVVGDLVFVFIGLMIEGMVYGDMDIVLLLVCDCWDLGEDSDWVLWCNFVWQLLIFGKLEKFYGDVDCLMWELVMLICCFLLLVDKICMLLVNDLYFGCIVIGGVIIIIDFNWVFSFIVNCQLYFVDQFKDVLVVWVYVLLMDQDGNYIKKLMLVCIGCEVLVELCYYLGIGDQIDVVVVVIRVWLVLMLYIIVQFMLCVVGDCLYVVLVGCINLGLFGQFVEMCNDVIFMMESLICMVCVVVYILFGLCKQVFDLSLIQYDICNLIKVVWVLNNNVLFFGEWLLY